MLNEKKVQDSTLDVHGFSADDGNADTGNKLPRQWEHVQDRRWKNISESKRQALTSLLPIEVK